MTGFFKVVSVLGNLLLAVIAVLTVVVAVVAGVLVLTPGLGESVFGS